MGGRNRTDPLKHEKQNLENMTFNDRNMFLYQTTKFCCDFKKINDK